MEFKNKNFIKIILIAITLFICCFISHNLYFRYKISSPMQDIEYKKSIIQDSHNIFYRLENLRPIVGEEELKQFLKENDKNPTAYTPSARNRANGVYRANLHMHTTNSDGRVSVKNRLDMAQEYAERYLKDGEFFYIAITDHNTVLGAKEIIRILQKYPGRYNKLKIVPGMEIFTSYNNSNVAEGHVDIHVLTWCINPYDEFLNKEFYKKDLGDRYNRQRPDRDFDNVIKMMSNYGFPVVAHPARYINHLGKDKFNYISEMLSRYKAINPKQAFTEGYYQSYYAHGDDKGADDFPQLLIYIQNEAEKLGIIRTGSTDSHGNSIFKL